LTVTAIAADDTVLNYFALNPRTTFNFSSSASSGWVAWMIPNPFTPSARFRRR